MIVQMVNAENADRDLIKRMYEGFDQAIGIESDKDTYEEFLEILSAADDQAKFYFTWIQEGDQVACGTVSVRLWVKETWYHAIVYAFTDPAFRKRGYARKVVGHLADAFDDTFLFCEVLDQSELSQSECEAEEKFSGVTCGQRERFWRLQGFRKAEFNYLNPGAGEENGSRNVISYNNLWIKSENNAIGSDQILQALQAYFFYEYGEREETQALAMIEKEIAGTEVKLL